MSDSSSVLGCIEEVNKVVFSKGQESSDLEERFLMIEKLMIAAGQSRLAIDAFRRQFEKAVAGDTGMIPSDTIEPVRDVPGLEDLDCYFDNGIEALKTAVIIKLNGGLGTNMGLDRAKTLLPAKSGLRFIDIILNQVVKLRVDHQIDLPLLMMDSFRTRQDTAAVFKERSDFLAGQNQIPVSFLQNKVPKLLRDSWQPVEWSKDPEACWCPPGHGDIYTALMQTGLIDQLLQSGYRYAFVSNGDNLCAQLDPRILGYMVVEEIPFLMEVAKRCEMDKKGGHLAQLLDQSALVLRESAQCPSADLADFQDISRWRYFNTNNNWLDLQAIRDKMLANGQILDLPLIRNAKTVDPADSSSPAVYQLETAMGSAISLFPKARLLTVPRCRFAPVKKTNDLLLLRSDLYKLEADSNIKQVADNSADQINVELDRIYDLIDAFEKRFPFGVPSLLECTSLKIRGDVLFGRDVCCQGDVLIVNESGTQKTVTDGEVLCGEVILG